MDRFPHLAQRLFNVPIAILPDKAEIVLAALADRLGIARLFREDQAFILSDGRARAFLDDAGVRQGREAGYDVVAGVAIIPICGTLVQKSGSLRPYSGMTGYDGIRMNFLTALEDAQVRGIALDIDSPGGEVSGCFDLVDMIHAARGQKPTWAILNETAYSAAYAIASAADRITVPRTGGTGSIGVVVMHTDFSRALDKAGITVTLLSYGDRKTDGNQFEPLDRAARARFQADIDMMGDLFVETVARNRGLRAADVRGQQARTFLGENGVRAGLADAVMAPDEAFRALIMSLDE
jgi:signal peptide peptidase SppA